MKIGIYDVAIIGGGPAGSTAAALLARAGRRVIVFEREKFPRFHIGESLLPFSMWVFYFLVRLQKHYPIVPRLTLVPKKEEVASSPQPLRAVS